MAGRQMIKSFSNTERGLLNTCLNVIRQRNLSNIPTANAGKHELADFFRDDETIDKIDNDGAKSEQLNSFFEAIRNEQIFGQDHSETLDEFKSFFPMHEKLINYKTLKKVEKEVTFLNKVEQCLVNQKRNYCFSFADKESKYRDDCPCPEPKKKASGKYVNVKLGGTPRIGRKSLPKIPSDCICVDPEPLKDVEPLKRLCPKEVKEPPKICPPEEVCEEHERADANLKVCPKELPPFPISDCPCMEPPPLRDFCIKRLEKKEIKPPVRVCPPPFVCPKAPRADEGLQVCRKKLKEIVPGDCPCEEPKPMDAPPLPKLVPKPVKEPKRVCKVCVDEICCPPRLDEGLKVCNKSLPALQNGDCPCVDPPPLQDVCLKRLPKKEVCPPQRICPPEIECPKAPRLDEGLKVQRKQFPKIGDADCPCFEIKIQDVAPLKRLCPKPVREPEKCKRICVEEKCCPPRLDANLKVCPKALPYIENSDCPCIDTPPLADVRLRRLEKKPVPEPKKICPEVEVCHLKTQKVEKKKLPLMPVSDCPCIEPEVPSITPRLRRLKKCPIPEPEKVCPVEETCDENPRADKDDWVYTLKKDEADSLLRTNSGNGGRRNFSTHPINAAEIYDILYASGLKRTNKQTLFKTSQNCSNGNIDSLNSFIDKLIGFCRFTKEAIILPYVNLVHQMSYVGNVAKSIRNYVSTSAVEFARSRKTIDDLQPRKPLIKEAEHVDDPYPDNIIKKLKKDRKVGIGLGRKEQRKDKKDDNCGGGKAEFRAVCEEEPVVECPPIQEVVCPPPRMAKRHINNLNKKCQKLHQKIRKKAKCNKHLQQTATIWAKIVNYFKARDCPSPEEFKMMYLRKEAEEAAKKAGLCVYDPKEICKEKMPKIINNCDSDSKKSKTKEC